MTAPSDDEIAEFSQLVVELQERLEQSFAAHDNIIARQAANEEENARLRAELASVQEPLASIRGLAAHASELSGKLRQALRPAVLDDKLQEEIDGLIQSLTDDLEQLAERATVVAGDPPPPEGAGDSAADNSGDPWAAEIKALSEEFPDQVFAAKDPSEKPSGDQNAPEQNGPAPQLPSQQSG